MQRADGGRKDRETGLVDIGLVEHLTDVEHGGHEHHDPNGGEQRDQARSRPDREGERQ